MTATAQDEYFPLDQSRNSRILVPGFYQKIEAEKYHALPALSASILKRTLEECPAAGWFESWLNPDRVEEIKDIMDVGTIVHSILLEGDYKKIALIDPELYPGAKGGVPKGWTNDNIRAARDAARGNGLIPVLPPDMVVIEGMVDSARLFIESLRYTEPAVWKALQPDQGYSESSIIWQDERTGKMCRIRPDRLANECDVMVDVKTTGTSANPERYARTMIPQQSSFMRAAFYRRGVQQHFRTNPAAYLFLVVETEPPHFCSLLGVDDEAFEFGDQKVDAALHLWHRCAESKIWPAYPNRVVWPQIPAYELTRWEEQQAGHAYHYDQMFGVEKTDEQFGGKK